MKPLPPPRKEDLLFRSDKSHIMANACVGWSGQPDILYSEGYLIAARSLAGQVCSTHTDQDLLIYPIVYLYRHHVELVLKRLTEIGAFLAGQELTTKQVKYLKKHELHQLWLNFEPLLQEVCRRCGQKISQADIQGIDSYVKQLGDFDPDGQAFRYAFTTKHNPSLPSDLKLINIAAFAEHLERLTYYLKSIDEFFHVMRDQKNEMLAEYDQT